MLGLLRAIASRTAQPAVRVARWCGSGSCRYAARREYDFSRPPSRSWQSTASCNGNQLATAGRNYLNVYDKVGNRTRTNNTTLAGDVTTYTYDNAYQLLSDRNPSIPAAANSYIYDPVGNRLTFHRSDASRATYTYNDANQLTRILDAGVPSTLTYDASGNPTLQKNTGQPFNITLTCATARGSEWPDSSCRRFVRCGCQDLSTRSRIRWKHCVDEPLAEVRGFQHAQILVDRCPQMFGSLLAQRAVQLSKKLRRRDQNEVVELAFGRGLFEIIAQQLGEAISLDLFRGGVRIHRRSLRAGHLTLMRAAGRGGTDVPVHFPACGVFELFDQRPIIFS